MNVFGNSIISRATYLVVKNWSFFCFPFSLSSRRVLLRSVTQKVYDLPTLLKGWRISCFQCIEELLQVHRHILDDLTHLCERRWECRRNSMQQVRRWWKCLWNKILFRIFVTHGGGMYVCVYVYSYYWCKRTAGRWWY